MLFSYPNVWNTCLLILRVQGFRLYLLGDPDEAGSISACSWNAEKNGMKFRGSNPIELLGLASVYHFHQPEVDTSYWWRLEGPNIVKELEASWSALVQENEATRTPGLPSTAVEDQIPPYGDRDARPHSH